MNSSTLTEIATGVVLLVWISYRQLTWTPVVPQRMWRMPAILTIIGVVLLIQENAFAHVTSMDLAVLAIEVVISVGLGAVMGVLAHFRPMSDDTRRAYAARNAARVQGVLPALETRNGWFGMALWLVLIATRIGGEFLAHATNSTLLTSTGIILLTVGLNRAVRILVITQRAERHPALVATEHTAA
jgi:hypothetical protein